MTVAAVGGYRCLSCRTLYLPPRRRCPRCGDDRREDVPLSGRGRLLVWTVIRVAPTRFQQEAPYTVALVEMEEGVRVMGRLEPGQEPERNRPVLVAEMDPLRGPIFRLA